MKRILVLLCLFSLPLIFSNCGRGSSKPTLLLPDKVNQMFDEINSHRPGNELELDDDLCDIAEAHAIWLDAQAPPAYAYEPIGDGGSTPDDRVYAVLLDTYTRPATETGWYGGEPVDEVYTWMDTIWPGVLDAPGYTDVGITAYL